MHQQRGVLTGIAALLLFSACRAPGRVGPDSDVRRPTAAAAAFPFAYSTSPQRYHLSQTAVVTPRDGQGDRARRMSTEAWVTVGVTALDPAVVVTTFVDSVRTVADSGIAPPVWARVAVDTVSAGSSLQMADRLCTEGSPATPPTSRFFLPLPQVITPGFTRVDSLVATRCHGPLPTRLTAVTAFSTGYTERAGAPVIDVTADYEFVGSGVSGQHNVHLSGSGVGRARVVLDPAAGTVRLAEETTTLELSVTASGRVQEVRQVTTTTISLLR